MNKRYSRYVFVDGTKPGMVLGRIVRVILCRKCALAAGWAPCCIAIAPEFDQPCQVCNKEDV